MNRIRRGNFAITSTRAVLIIIFIAFIVAFAATQYDTVRDTVRFICISCLGLSG